MRMTEIIPNFTLTPDMMIGPGQKGYYTYTKHLFELSDILFIVAIFAALAYGYIVVSKDREKYEHWMNPRGREVNLYKIVRRAFWMYTVMVIVLSIIQILMVK